MEKRPWHDSYTPQVPASQTYEKVTIPQALSRSAKRFPKNTALNYMGRLISYAELEQLTNRFARALMDMGVKKGDKVAVCLPNIPQTVIANMAIFRLGAVPVQNNPLYTERELSYQLNDSDSKILVTLTLLLPRVEKILPETKLEKIILCHIHSFLPFAKRLLFPFVKKDMVRKVSPSENVLIFKDLIYRHSSDPVEDKSEWDDLAALIYTGGTTGVSKGVMLSHANLSKNVQQFVAWTPSLKDGEEKMLGTFPIFHSAGFTSGQNFCAWKAWEYILVPRPEPDVIIQMLKKYKPSFLPGVPTIFTGLLADKKFLDMDLSFVKGYFSGAAPLPEDIIRKIQELSGSAICEVYGATETSPIVSASPWGGKIKAGTVGLPAPDTDVKIVDPETGEKEMPIGETGEILIKGPQIMMGYYKKPEVTADTVKDGWYYSGDIGKLDEEGYLSIVDRKKDMVIAGGYNIFPVEIDNALFDHPKIMEACVIGIPDEYRGETLKAFVTPKKGENLTKEEIIQHCKKVLAPYKVPKIIEFTDEIPKSAVGKILRRKLRDMEMEKIDSSAQ